MFNCARTARAALLSLCIALICLATIRADDSATAKEILSTPGVRAGLCLRLGYGRADSPGLTAALAENGLAVHSLAIDDAALARTREKTKANGLLGRATAEKLALNPLPYVFDLAVVNNKVLPSLQDGTLLCLGK